MTQCEQLIEHFDKGMSITSLEAVNLYRIMRLASRINDLKKAGYPIITETVTSENGGKKATFARYRKG